MGFWRSGAMDSPTSYAAQSAYEASQAAQGSGQASPDALPQGVQRQVDQIVRQRLEQAFGSVFGKVMQATERAANAAEAQAAVVRQDGLTKMMKIDAWKPSTGEEELKTWREWQFQFLTWLSAHDAKFAEDLAAIDPEIPEDHALMNETKVQRSQKLYGILVSLLRGRPLLLVKGLERDRAGFEAMRVLRREMERKERSRALAIMRQLASWTFREGGLHEQLIQFEEAVSSYEVASSKVYPEDLVIATIVGGLREPLRSQVQLRLTGKTTYAEIREWILQYEAVNAPWSSTLGVRSGTKDQQGGGPQPMEVDRVWAKGKEGKGKKGEKGDAKGKKGKGKTKDGKGKVGQSQWNQQGNQWKQQTNNQWNQQGSQWKQQASNQWNQHGSQWRPAGGAGKGKGKCHTCGQSGHWKWECPLKGKGKGINQVDASSSSASTAPSSSSGASTAPSSATAFNKASGYVNRVEVSLGTPPGCEVTQLFDISELDDPDEDGPFSLEPAEVMVVQAVPQGTRLEGDWLKWPKPQVFCLDATDGDGRWTLPEYEPNLRMEPVVAVRAVTANRAEKVEVVVDSGADVSVAPRPFAACGSPGDPSAVIMHDAQGNRTRILDIAVQGLDGETATIREKFAIADVGSVILSLGRLMRCGWELAQESRQPMIKKDGCRLPIRLRRNTLTLMGMVSLIASGCAGPPGPGHVQVNALTFDDVGALAPEAEDVTSVPGWHILGSGLPFLVVHKTEDLHMEQNLWSPTDWPWAAVFVRMDPATRLPKPGDAWTQVVAMKTEDLSQAPGRLTEFNGELTGPRDVCILLHVEELPKDLLSRPQDYFKAPEDDCIAVPAGEVEGGAGVMPDEVVAEERNMDVEEADGEQLDGF